MKSVSIITRTKNRELFLQRALKSVLSQKFRDFVWIVINDGGENDSVATIVNEAKASGIETRLIYNSVSSGMEAASNKAIKSVDSKYIAIHDDDDTWHEDFLGKTVHVLNKSKNFHGVVTYTQRIDEKISNNQINQIRCFPFGPKFEHLLLFDLLTTNRFPPISFVYSREAYTSIDGYDESLPVLGDWDFNIRFLLKFDITILPEFLANYHHRTNLLNPADENSNTVVASKDQHEYYRNVIKNKYLRNDINNGQAGLGFAFNLLQISAENNLRYQKSFFLNIDRALLRMVSPLKSCLGLKKN